MNEDVFIKTAGKEIKCSPDLIISIDPKFLAEFWDWMHYEWYESGCDGCSTSSSESFMEYVDKFLKEKDAL